MAEPVIPGVRTGVVYSEQDVISPVDAIETMMAGWSDQLELYSMRTQSKHLLHMRDEPQRYESLVDDVLQLTPIVSGSCNGNAAANGLSAAPAA